jgi:DNA-binding transcriptional LysR family regulator
MHVMSTISVAEQYRELRERNVDLVIGRIPPSVEKDIEAEILLRDPLFVVTSPKSRWARRRKIELSELADEAWVLPPVGTIVGTLIGDAFRASGMDFLPRGAATGSIHLALALLARGSHLAIFPGSVLRLARHLPPFKILPVSLPSPPWPVGIMTLKNRTQNPVTKLFIACAREVTGPLAKQAL